MRFKFKKINKITIGLITFSVFLLFFVLFTDSASAVLLAPLPYSGDAEKNPGGYIEAIYKLSIGIAGVLAVLMIVIGGIEYIASAANPSLKESAKKRIWAAIGGLLLALSAYIILNTINPKLVGFDFKLTPITIPEKIDPKTKSKNSIGSGGEKYVWIKIPTNKNCNDVLQTPDKKYWVKNDSSKCPKETKPTWEYSCCGLFSNK